MSKVHPDFRYDLDIDLTKVDSSAFAIIAAISTALKRAGYSTEVKNHWLEQAISGDYDELLALAIEYAGY